MDEYEKEALKRREKMWNETEKKLKSRKCFHYSTHNLDKVCRTCENIKDNLKDIIPNNSKLFSFRAIRQL